MSFATLPTPSFGTHFYNATAYNKTRRTYIASGLLENMSIVKSVDVKM